MLATYLAWFALLVSSSAMYLARFALFTAYWLCLLALFAVFNKEYSLFQGLGGCLVTRSSTFCAAGKTVDVHLAAVKT